MAISVILASPRLAELLVYKKNGLALADEATSADVRDRPSIELGKRFAAPVQ
jgi:hypothetical protein